MALNIRKLGLKDQKALAVLTQEDRDFDIPGRGEPQPALQGAAARRYLGNPLLCHWVAEEKGKILGFLCGYYLPMRSAKGDEFLLYETGVRKAHRGRGVGKALMKTMFDWMESNRIPVVWVIADNPGALKFYGKCGFEKVEGSLTQMERRLSGT
ncbi:MAG TPA: GNAT family N-acetyltransferase [bacterium]|jgi:ribosomal protein S18 acetylase RimI-like enzyme|nr:GNAT family N-acetyltransferase [bacterium]